MQWANVMFVMSTQTTIDQDKRAGLYAFGLQTSENFAYSFEKNDEGSSAVVRNLPIFKAGTFADSMGYTETWTREHLAQMVSNFATLNESFPNVPVRLDHTRTIQSVVGYLDGLQSDGDLLLVDFTLTEPEAVSRWERGTYRSRSAEIGYWETNDGAGHWPVFQGFAFVDIPSVEGLFSKSDQPTNARFFREAPVGSTKSEDTKDPEVDPVKQPVAELTKPTEVAKFTIGGKEISDPAEVQAHIARMEQFANEQVAAARTSFAKTLVTDSKLGAPQEEAMTKFALSLDGDQFTKLEAVFSAAPKLPVLDDHSAGSITNPNGEDRHSDIDQQIEDAEEILAMHARAGMTKEQIDQTSSFTKLAALRAERNK